MSRVQNHRRPSHTRDFKKGTYCFSVRYMSGVHCTIAVRKPKDLHIKIEPLVNWLLVYFDILPVSDACFVYFCTVDCLCYSLGYCTTGSWCYSLGYCTADFRCSSQGCCTDQMLLLEQYCLDAILPSVYFVSHAISSTISNLYRLVQNFHVNEYGSWNGYTNGHYWVGSFHLKPHNFGPKKMYGLRFFLRQVY